MRSPLLRLVSPAARVRRTASHLASSEKGKLAGLGIIFCSFSEAVREHPELVKKYLGSVVPYTDNFFATLNSAVFSDGSFAYIPKGVRCPMELSTYFRINAKNTGQFERTLIVADEGASVSYLEGCTAPMRDTNQLHAAVVELVAAVDDEHVAHAGERAHLFHFGARDLPAGTVDQCIGAIAKQPALGDVAGVHLFSRHGLDWIAPEGNDRTHDPSR